MVKRGTQPIRPTRLLFSTSPGQADQAPTLAPTAAPIAAPISAPTAAPTAPISAPTAAPTAHPRVATAPTAPPRAITAPTAPTLSNEQPSVEMEVDEEECEVDEDEETTTQTPSQSLNQEEASGSTSSGSKRMLVGLAGNNVRDFEPRQPAFGKMVDIVHGHYTGIWTSLNKVPATQKELWFKEFEKSFYWTVSTNQMKKTFVHQAADHIRNVFKACRSRGTVPSFIGVKQLQAMEKLRKTDKNMLHQAEVNKKNKASQRAKESGVYRGGSRKLTKHLEESRNDGTKPMISDMVRKLFTTSNGEWTGSRPKAYVEEFERLVAKEFPSSSSEDACNGESRQKLTEEREKRIWYDACEGANHGRIYGLGEEGAALIRNGMVNTRIPKNTSNSSQSFEESQVQPLKEEMKVIQSTLQEFMQQQNQQKEFMQQIMQQLGQLQGSQVMLSNGSSSNPAP